MSIIGLVGTSGFGREVMPILQATRRDKFKRVECVFVDAIVPKTSIDGIKVLLDQDFLEKKSKKKLFNVAIGNPKVRKKVVEKFLEEGCDPVSIMSQSSLVLDRVAIGEGAIVCGFSHLTSDIKIGNYFHCNIYSYVAHDCIIGNYVTFAPKVSCNGNVHIQDYAYIGAGSVIKQGTPGKPLVIGEGATVGMGAVVTKDVAPYEVVVGNPARPLKK